MTPPRHSVLVRSVRRWRAIAAARASHRRGPGGLESLEHGQAGPGEPAAVQEERADPLTRREREVAALVARGLSNRAIARGLVITEATAERHIGNVFAKLGLASPAQLAVWAHDHGLAPPRSD